MEARFKERTTKNLKARNIGRIIHKDAEMNELKQKMEEEQSATPQPVNVADEMARPISDAEAIELGIIRNGYSWSDIMRGSLGLAVGGAGVAYIGDQLNRDRQYQRQMEQDLVSREKTSDKVREAGGFKIPEEAQMRMGEMVAERIPYIRQLNLEKASRARGGAGRMIGRGLFRGVNQRMVERMSVADPIDPPGMSLRKDPSVSEFPSVPPLDPNLKRRQQQEALRRVEGYMEALPINRKFGTGNVLPQRRGEPLIPYLQSFDPVLKAIRKRKQ